MAGETLEGAYVIQQLARVLPVWEAQGRIGRDELPLLRMLCRTIAGDAAVEIPFGAIFGGDYLLNTYAARGAAPGS